MAGTSLQEKVAQLRKEQEGYERSATTEQGGKTIFQKTKELKSERPPMLQEDELQKVTQALEATSKSLGLDDETASQVKGAIMKDALRRHKKEGVFDTISTVLALLIVGTLVAGAIIGVVGLAKWVFGF